MSIRLISTITSQSLFRIINPVFDFFLKSLQGIIFSSLTHTFHYYQYGHSGRVQLSSEKYFLNWGLIFGQSFLYARRPNP